RSRQIITVGDLAAREPGEILDIKGVGEKTAIDYIRRARALSTGVAISVAEPAVPSDPVIIFDIESVPAEGLYYLFGTLVIDGGLPYFEAHLAESAAGEEAAWRSFVRAAEARPGAIVHYANYERTAVKKLGERYGTEAQAEALLARMVDLEKVMRESFAL